MSVMTPSGIVPALEPTAGSGLALRYHALLSAEQYDSAPWLREQLARVATRADDLPATAESLARWSCQRAAQVAKAYAVYLQGRRNGEPRRYFLNRSQALYFLQHVAPTKKVDGAWLYGMLKHWQDPRYHGLIRTYLEELGDGVAACNHVLIYQRLLSQLGCLEPVPLADERYLQGTLQLALGFHTDDFLPEVLGYNLGYEQLPLHLLISAYELAELGIDSHYFSLHVTIDNPASGHAQKAVQAVQQMWPASGGAVFYRRLARGYRLNELGADTPSVIASFDLERELLAALERKRSFGQYLHSDYCRLQGRTVNQWLAQPGSMLAFLQALEGQGWIKRNQDPTGSRFWHLVEGPKAAMFGVFSPYEKQLIHDWIAGQWQAPVARSGRYSPAPNGLESESAMPVPTAIEALIGKMAGADHALPEGLAATRAYIRLTGLGQGSAR
ncbi:MULTISPECIES: iron-containing redox enzyme family protein [Pseudomonas]